MIQNPTLYYWLHSIKTLLVSRSAKHCLCNGKSERVPATEAGYVQHAERSKGGCCQLPSCRICRCAKRLCCCTTDFHGFVKIFRRRWDRMRSTKIESWICLPWCLAVKLLWDPKSLLLTGHFHCSEFKSIFGGECRLGRHPGSQDWAQTVLLGAGHVPNELWSWNNCFHGKRRFYIHLL